MMFNKVYFLRPVIEIVKEEILLTRNRVETGGVMMGYYSDGNQIVITHASPPGKDAIRSRDLIKFDIPYCQSFINQIYEETNGQVTYIGDWHSHTTNILLPSCVDKHELKRTSLSKRSRLKNPLMLIAYRRGNYFNCETFAYNNGLVLRMRNVIHSQYSFEEL